MCICEWPDQCDGGGMLHCEGCGGECECGGCEMCERPNDDDWDEELDEYIDEGDEA